MSDEMPINWMPERYSGDEEDLHVLRILKVLSHYRDRLRDACRVDRLGAMVGVLKWQDGYGSKNGLTVSKKGAI